MKATDLNIFDWVLWDNAPCQVTAIGCDYIETTKCGITLAESHLLNPIPLTPEILGQNGFEYIRFGYVEKEETCATEAIHQWRLENSRFALDDDSWWRSIKDGKLHVNFGGFPLEYVHQLQHALRLCGIDKEIEL